MITSNFVTKKKVHTNISKIKLNNFLKYAVMSVYLVIAIFPIYFALISSVKESKDIFLSPFSLPSELHFENFVRAIKIGNIGISFRNSVILSGGSIIVIVFAGSLAAYILARFNFKAKNGLLVFFISGMMIPMQSVIIPLSYVFGKFGIHNNYMVMILLFTAFNLPITIFIINGFLRTIPSEIEEAAVIDGSGAFRIFSQIIFPISLPAISTAAIFNFINIWNNLLFPLVFITRRDLQVIALALQSFFAERVSDYGGVMAAIVLSILPPMIAYIFFQEKVEKGMTSGAVKG